MVVVVAVRCIRHHELQLVEAIHIDAHRASRISSRERAAIEKQHAIGPNFECEGKLMTVVGFSFATPAAPSNSMCSMLQWLPSTSMSALNIENTTPAIVVALQACISDIAILESEPMRIEVPVCTYRAVSAVGHAEAAQQRK
jgi:hypothetical protein